MSIPSVLIHTWTHWDQVVSTIRTRLYQSGGPENWEVIEWRCWVLIALKWLSMIWLPRTFLSFLPGTDTNFTSSLSDIRLHFIVEWDVTPFHRWMRCDSISSLNEMRLHSFVEWDAGRWMGDSIWSLLLPSSTPSNFWRQSVERLVLTLRDWWHWQGIERTLYHGTKEWSAREILHHQKIKLENIFSWLSNQFPVESMSANKSHP